MDRLPKEGANVKSVFAGLYALAFVFVAVGEIIQGLPFLLWVGNIVLAGVMMLFVVPDRRIWTAEKKIGGIVTYTTLGLFLAVLALAFIGVTWPLIYAFQLGAVSCIAAMFTWKPSL